MAQLYWLKDFKKDTKNDNKHTTSTQQGGNGLMSLMTELKRDRFVFVGWSGLLLFPTAYLAIGGGLLARRLLQVMVHPRVGV